ncbi:MAG: PTS glucitol/sorbitol transporter subunit IIC [Actinomycetota bacterium]|nr:PTS glucitol/sorbitol transporter subunit IIC [Actinomycetota bacterium]
MLDALVRAADAFIKIFEEGANFFGTIFTDVLPLVLILLTAVNALIRFVGQERVDRLAGFAGRPSLAYAPVRFLVLPVVAVFFLTNPACYSMGAFLEERNKAAFYDSAVSFVHPILGLFPHANSAELFVWLGIAQGVSQAGVARTPLAVRYFLVGLAVILLRGIVTQIIFDFLSRRQAGGKEQATEGASA